MFHFPLNIHLERGTNGVWILTNILPDIITSIHNHPKY